MGWAQVGRLRGPWRRAGGLFAPIALVALALGLVLVFPREHGTGTRRGFPVSTPAAVAPAPLKVYLAGAVQQPGVYTLSEGDRLDDLLRLAGGPAPDADLEAVNLAARLRDGQQVIIPRAGETPAEPAPAGALINLNTASQALLESLPDIGEVRAQRIIASRDQDGPFREPRDLVTRKILTERIFTKLRDRITVQ